MPTESKRISTGMPNLDEHRKNRIDAFARYVAVLPWFSVDVLHKLYLNIFTKYYEEAPEILEDASAYEIRAIACADLMHSPQVSRMDYNVFTLEDEIREVLRAEVKKDKELLEKLGEFMLAYAETCRNQFLGARYREVFKIEGNLIVNPLAAAMDISNHIVRQLKKSHSTGQKEKTVEYYLDLIDQDETKEGYKELITFLEGTRDWIQGDTEKAQSKLRQLSYEEENAGKSISVKLPTAVKKKILEDFRERNQQRVTQQAPPKKPEGKGDVYALLVGIDEYMDPVPSLYSAVNDARAMQAYFQDHISREKLNLKMLLNEEATRDNIIEGFKDHLARAKEGDIACFYFSGHGSQEVAHEAFWKYEADKRLETLVCYDSRSPGGYDLADKELATLLEEVGENNPHIVVIMDCCHSGSEDRNTDSSARRAPINESTRSLDSFLLSDENKAALLSENYDEFRLPNPRHILLAATQSHQLAKETKIEGESRGIFSHALLEVLKSATRPLTYANLFQEIKEKVSKRVQDQTPSLEVFSGADPHMLFLGEAITHEFKLRPLNIFIKGTNLQEVEFIQSGLEDLQKASDHTYYRWVESETASDYTLYLDRGILYTTPPFQYDKPLIKAIQIVDDAGRYLNYMVSLAHNNLVHMARWNYIKNLTYTESQDISQFVDKDITMFPVELVMYRYDEDTRTERRFLPDGDNNFFFIITSEKRREFFFRLEVINHSKEKYYCTLLHLSNTFGINASLIKSSQALLMPGESVTSKGIKKENDNRYIRYHQENEGYIREFNLAGVQQYFKLLVSRNAFDVEALTLADLSVPLKSGKVDQSRQIFPLLSDLESPFPSINNEIHTFGLYFPNPHYVEEEDKTELPPKTSHFTWCLDNGHGKLQEGRRSPVAEDGSQLLEYEINRDIVVRITKQLDELGIDYFEVAPEVETIDNFIKERATRTNGEASSRPKLFLSVHSNAGPTSNPNEWSEAQGIETWFVHESPEGKILASVFQKHLINETGWKDRGVKSKEDNQFYLLKNVDCPAILTENGFYNNREQFEELKKDSVRQKLAGAHVKAILEVEEKYETIFGEELEINRQDTKAYIELIKSLIANNEIVEVFNRLDIFSKILSLSKGNTEQDMFSDIILLEQRWSRVTREVIQGLLRPDESALEQNKIRKSILDLLIELEDFGLDIRGGLEISPEKEETKTEFERIFDLIKKDEVKEIFGILKQILHNSSEMDLLNEVSILNQRYQDLMKQKRRGTILRNDENVEQNQITYGLIELTKEIEAQLSKKQILTKILFLASNPTDTGRLRLGAELRDIEEGLKLSENRDNFELESRFAVRAMGLSHAMLEEEPQMIHFSGHGVLLKDITSDKLGTRSLEWEEFEDKESLKGLSGGIALEDADGKPKIVKAEALGGLFELFGENIKCVFLNACYSDAQAEEIIKHVPYIVGMNSAVPDDTAMAFATAFYDALGAGRDIEFAFKLAKNRIQLEGLHGSDIPVLRTRLSNQQSKSKLDFRDKEGEFNILRKEGKILFLASNPTDTGRLRLGVEHRDIEEGLKLPKNRDSFKLESRFAVRTKDLSRAMLEEEPQIIHFSGHGVMLNAETSDMPGTRFLEWEEFEEKESLKGLSGGIALEDSEGKAKIVQAAALGGLFELFGENIKCVFLNACYSDVQADEIIKHVPYVVGMSMAVPDDTAMAFATGFYDVLGAGRDIEFAFKLAKNRIELEGLYGADIPVLRKRGE